MEERNLVIVAGVPGSGRQTFAACYKNSFLKSLPLLENKNDISKALSGGESFATIIPLTNESHQALIDIAKMAKYKITLFYLFAGKILSLQRCRFKTISKGITYDPKQLKEDYEESFKGLLAAYEKTDLTFLILNQKEFRFNSAFDPKEVPLQKFQKAVKDVKKAVDTLL